MFHKQSVWNTLNKAKRAFVTNENVSVFISAQRAALSGILEVDRETHTPCVRSRVSSK